MKTFLKIFFISPYRVDEPRYKETKAIFWPQNNFSFFKKINLKNAIFIAGHLSKCRDSKGNETAMPPIQNLYF
jgi:hypothetical protein